MRIVHFSDLHGRVVLLPPADVYVCSGDMLPNYPIIEYLTHAGESKVWDLSKDPETPSDFKTSVGRAVIPEQEELHQLKWMHEHARVWADALGNRDAEVLCVRGNHDFIPLAPLFPNGVELGDGYHTTHGLKFGGMRGIPYIAGEWSDELEDADLDQRFRSLDDDVDVLVTHCPPKGVMDDYYGMQLGSAGLAAYVMRRLYTEHPLKLHCFGHIHSKHGRDGIFSNAATTFKVIDI